MTLRSRKIALDGFIGLVYWPVMGLLSSRKRTRVTDFFFPFFLRKHSNGHTESESEGNFIALQITHYLKRACYRIDVRYKGRRYLPVLAFFRWIKIAKN